MYSIHKLTTKLYNNNLYKIMIMAALSQPQIGEVVVPSRIDVPTEHTVIYVKIYPKTIQLHCNALLKKDLVMNTLEEYDTWWRNFKKKYPTAGRHGIKFVTTKNGLNVIQRRLASPRYS